MNIVGEKIILRALEEKDLPKLHAWANDPEIWRMLGDWHFPYSAKSVNKWFEGLQSDKTNLRFGIEDIASGELIGTANLVDINWKDRNAFHGMMLGDPAVRGKGYGTDVVKTVMRYAFDELGLNRLDGSMIEYNSASISLYTRKCGWSIEGIKKQWYFRGGRYWDKVVVGITAEDYHSFIASK